MSEVDNDGFREVVRLAHEGPATKKVRWIVDGRLFNIKPLKVTEVNNGHLYERKKFLSKRRKFKKDPQVNVSFFVSHDSTVSNVKISFVSSADQFKKWAKILAEYVPVIIGIFGADGKEDATDPYARAEPFPESLKLLDGSWKGEAQFLIANVIGVAVDKSKQK